MSTMASTEGFSAELKVAKKKDVVVVGAGPAGCIAALSARRNGADTLLIERESALGGMLTGGGVGIFGINGYRSGSPGNPIVVQGIGMEIFRKLQKTGGALPGEPVYPRQIIDHTILAHLLDEMMEESNVDVLFNTIAFDAVVENNVVKGVAIANKSGGQVILADVVIDASADGDIAAAAGAPFTFGRTEDGRYHGGSMEMQIGGIDVDRFIAYLKNQPPLTEEERRELEADRSRLLGGGGDANASLSLDGRKIVREGRASPLDWEAVEKARREGEPIPLRMTGGAPLLGKDGKYVPLPPGLEKEWLEYIKNGQVPPLFGLTALVFPPPRFGSFNTLGQFKHGKWRHDQMLSGIYEAWFDTRDQEEISEAILYMRKVNKIYLKFLRERIPGFENAYIILEFPTVGTREGRIIVGEYTLNEGDLLEGRKFPDVIAKGGTRGPGIHSHTGIWGDSVSSPLTRPYDIPYRCLIPKTIENLLLSGRMMSATHLVFGATRSMAVAMSTGEAAGAAAALSSKLGVTPRNINIKLLQKALLRGGALLFLEDEEARRKEVLASD